MVSLCASQLLALLALACPCVATVQCIVSPLTPANVVPLLRVVFGESVHVSRFSSSAEIAVEFDSVILDYSYDAEISFALPQRQAVVLWPRDHEDDWTLKPSIRRTARELTKYVTRLNFTGVLLVVDDDVQRLRASHEVAEEFPNVYDEVVVIPANSCLDYMLKVVGKVIKPTGRNLFAILSGEATALNFLRALEAKKLNKAGFAYILADSAAFYEKSAETGLLSTGVLSVVPAICAEARSVDECELAYLSTIALWVKSGAMEALKDTINPSFVLVNVQKSKPSIVALSPDSIDLSMAVFAGESAVLPKRQRTVIPTSVNYYVVNADGWVHPQSRQVMRGAQVAFQERNNSTDFAQGFHVHDEALGLMGTTFNHSFTLANVLRDRSRLGVIHFPFPGGIDIVGTFKVFDELNITLPMCMTCSLTTLSSPMKYPLYLRPRVNSNYIAMVIGKMCQYYGWKRLAVIYAKDDGDNEDLYRAFLVYSQVYKINITNEEASRGLTEAIVSGATAQLNASIAEVMASSARILLMFHYDMPIILEAMYDKGLRSEYLILTWTALSYTFFAGTEFRYEKRRIVGRGAIQFFPRLFVDEVGQRVLKELLAWDGNRYYSNSCFYYDSVMLYLRANEYLIRMGLDYEDPFEIVRAMRGTYFKGCTGMVKISPETNEVSASEFTLMNLKYFEGNRSLLIEDVMFYNPFSITLYRAVNPIVWPDNTTGVYTDTFISLFDCPFLEKEIRDFRPGRAIGLTVSFGVCFITAVATALIWKRWWNKYYLMVAPHTELSADDIMQMAAVPLEFLQFAGVGPESKELNQLISSLANVSTLQLESVLSATGSTYWFLVYFALGSVAWYTVLTVLKLKGLEKRLECLPLWSLLMLFANLALPVLSNLMFLPIVSTLSKLFLCYHSVGDSLKSSFLNKDCYTFCWTGTHVPFTISGSFALALYIPLGVYAKPMWQEVQPLLHIKAQPLPLMVKSVMQVLLLTLSNTLKEESPDVQAGLFFACMLLYIVFLLRTPPYNYHRLNMWTMISMCLVLTFSAAAFIARKHPSLSFPILVAFAVLTAMSLLTGVVLQKIVKVFSTKFYHRHMDPSNIIGFAFSFGNRAARYLDTHNVSKYYTDSEGLSRVPRTSQAMM